jgi:isoquinoline 1-oxidoreductase
VTSPRRRTPRSRRRPPPPPARPGGAAHTEREIEALPYDIEAERYELLAGPAHRFSFGRRAFFRSLGTGLLVVSWLRPARAQETGGGRGGGRGGRGGGGPAPADIGAWLHIAENGTVTAYTGKAEVGQGIRTTLAQAVAEELGAPLGAVSLVMADTMQTPFDMGTFGSRTTPSMLPQLRRAAAAARQWLTERAAAELKVPVAELRVEGGTVVHAGGGPSLPIGKITKGEKMAAAIASDIALKPVAAWSVLGRPERAVDGRAVVTGERRYATDIKRPGLKWGKVLRPPRFGATLESLDDRAARKIAGVKVVRDGGFAGVVAADEDGAAKALAALEATWKEPVEPAVAAGELFDYLKKNASGSGGGGGGGGTAGRSEADTAGDIEGALRGARHRIEQSYTAAYIAHAPLEPRAAVAEWSRDRLTVWTGTQRPFGVRRELAESMRVPEDSVRVIVPDTGAGYGGKHTGDAAVEAARLARAAGAPVKVVWTREEEFTWAYFRPAGVIDIRAGADGSGRLVAWEHHNYNSGGSALRTPYEVASRRQAFHSTRSPLRQGSYRALAATFNHFARESAMDELAALAKMDPLEFRRRNLRNERVRAVLDAAAERYRWGASRSTREVGHGLACGFDKGGYVASFAEVHVDRTRGALRVARVVTAFECGAVVNPDNLRNQVDGAVIMGLGGALFESIDFADGRVLNPRFGAYRVPRFGDVPKLETVLVDRKDLPPAGAGETPIVAIAPAIANALFAASGERHRGLPLRPQRG